MVTEPTTFQETDWADGFIQFVKAAGSKAPFIVKYLVSKTLAERGKCISHLLKRLATKYLRPERTAAWEFYEQHKSEVGWDFTTILPPQVMGVRFITFFPCQESMSFNVPF